MDDLTGLNWSGAAKPQDQKPPLAPRRPAQSPFSSGTTTPNIARQSSPSNSQPLLKIAPRSSTPSNDSFASLLSNGQSKSNNLSLLERQRLQQEEKARKAEEDRRRLDSHFGSQHDTHWDQLSAQAPKPGRSARAPVVEQNSGDGDLFSAFDASTPVNTSSHYPPPGQHLAPPASVPSRQPERTLPAMLDDDDDPFGLNQLASKPAPKAERFAAASEDDDILGMLGRPVEEVAATRKPEPQHVARETDNVELESSDPADGALAELVDMGFPPDRAAAALAQTSSGHSVQDAVGILITQAHESSRKKTNGDGKPRKHDDQPHVTTSRITRGGESTPPWMNASEQDSRSGSRNRGQGGEEKDVAQLASSIGTSLFKSANSIWKSGQKQVRRAVAEFQQDGDPNQPKWMRDLKAAEMAKAESQRPKVDSKASVPDRTDEAMMLDSDRALNSRAGRQVPDVPLDDGSRAKPIAHRTASPLSRERPAGSSARHLRQDLSDAPQAYVSPNRRRKPQQVPDVTEPKPTIRNERLDEPPPSLPSRTSNNPFRTKPVSPETITKPKPKARKIPEVSSSAISTSAAHRQAGTEAFKRGDFAEAHSAYTRALQPLPPSHPALIVLYCNRALTSIKVGDPKAAIADADSALEIIGVSRGEGEQISLGHAEAPKDMKEFYGKALMRKAEGLENTEKWTEAARIWKQAVEAGVGGSISIQGRNRCEKAAGARSQPPAPPARAPPARRPQQAGGARPVAAASVSRPAQAASAQAVRALRAANAAAERADDEKFALTDHVDAKLVAWKGSKADNLRALLGSLDRVLWAEAGWAKVGMQDLVVPGRVKIVYMKAIAKVHPDKIPQTATTEQRMISAAVFSTLNEAWDKFKTENGL